MAIGLKAQRHMVFCIAALGEPTIMYARVLQFGQGYLTPNNPNTVPSIVKYGYSANNLEFTETGFAEVMLTHLPACISSNPISLCRHACQQIPQLCLIRQSACLNSLWDWQPSPLAGTLPLRAPCLSSPNALTGSGRH